MQGMPPFTGHADGREKIAKYGFLLKKKGKTVF